MCVSGHDSVEDPIQTLSTLVRPGKALAFEGSDRTVVGISPPCAFQFLETTPRYD